MNKIKVKKGFATTFYDEKEGICTKKIRQNEVIYAFVEFMEKNAISYEIVDTVTIVPTITIPIDAKVMWQIEENILTGADKLRPVVSDLLLMKKRAQAIELVALEFQKHNKIYAIRNDEKNEMWIYYDGIYLQNGKTYIEEYCKEAFGISYTTNISNSVAKLIQIDNYINQDKFFAIQKNKLICLKNGILDLQTMQLLDYSKEYIFFSKINANYDKNAKCEKFLAFVNDIVETQEDIDIIQEVFGWFFYKKYAFEKIIMFIGDGRNGKSKLIEIMTHFLSPESVSQITPHTMEDEDSFSLSSMFGKLANLVADIGDGNLTKTQKLKALSGNDIIQAKRKFMTDLHFQNVAKMVFGCNELPIIYDRKAGMWERWILIQFPYKFVDAERVGENSKHKLRKENIVESIINDTKEMSGLLNWALEGYKRLEQKGKFSYSKTPQQTQSQWLRKADSFESFVLDCCELEYGLEISKEDLRRHYVQYVNEHKLKLKNANHIARSLGERGISDIRRKGYDSEYMWQGIRLKTAVVPQENKKQRVKEFLAQLPNNNAYLLGVAFGEDYVRNLVEKGELIEARNGTLIMGDK
jgi:P4 family phage/plasmid primase-like protien